MKKYILPLLFISLIFVGRQVSAQVGQGLFAGGSLGITSSSGTTSTTSTTGGTSTTTESDKPKNSSFSIMPRVGYFFTDNIGAGLMIGYTNRKTQSISTSGNTTTTTTTTSGIFNVGLFGRFAKQLGEGDFYIYGDLGFGISSGNSEVETEVKTSTTTTTTTADGPKTSTFGINITPGILYFPTKKIGLEASLGNIFSYTSTKITTESTSGNTTTKVEDRTNDIEVLNVSSLSFTFGLNFYFNR